jgi:hypothetical protein
MSRKTNELLCGSMTPQFLTATPGLSELDFDIESIGRQAMSNNVLPDGYGQSTTKAEQGIPQVKVSAQRRHTVKHLKSLVKDF